MDATKNTNPKKTMGEMPDVMPLGEAAIRAVKGFALELFNDIPLRTRAHRGMAARVVPGRVVLVTKEDLIAMPMMVGDVQFIMLENGKFFRKLLKGLAEPVSPKDVILFDEGMLYPLGDIYPMGLGHRVDVLCVRD